MPSRSDEPDALTESAFDRELKEALDIDPSPEFLARVRTRLASEPEPSAWGFPWLFAAAAGAVAMVVAAVVVTSRFDQPPISKSVDVTLPAEPQAGIAPSNRADTANTGAEQTFRLREFRGTARAGAASVRRTVALSGQSDPDVLVSPAEIRGLRRLIALASQGDAGLESLLAASADLVPISEIKVDEIVIAPIKIDLLAPETY